MFFSSYSYGRCGYWQPRIPVRLVQLKVCKNIRYVGCASAEVPAAAPTFAFLLRPFARAFNFYRHVECHRRASGYSCCASSVAVSLDLEILVDLFQEVNWLFVQEKNSFGFNLSGLVPRFPGRTFNVIGNALICPTGNEKECYGAIPIPMSFNINNDSPGDQSIQKSKRHTIICPVAYGLACICFISLALGLLIWCHKRRSQQVFFDANDQHKVICLGNLKRFQFRELQIATNGFSSKNSLCKGGFGNVYKGKLQGRTLVAVKRLDGGNVASREIQFKAEVEMISLAIHRHILRLCGFCMTTTEKLLDVFYFPFPS